jgi:hypothetical protein
MFDLYRLREISLRHGLNVLLSIFKGMKFNKSLYCFALPGSILGTGGLYMGFNFAQTFHPGEGFDMGTVALTFLLTFTGTFMVFTGILLHSIAGLIRYKKGTRKPANQVNDTRSFKNC